MRRLSIPIEGISEHYEFVVVGSGYGGAIAAARLAGAGRRVAVLERGKEIHPGEFPRTALEALRTSQASTPSGHIGPASGLFDYHVNRDVSVLVGCGLGGTSLINSNVALPGGPGVFDDDRWPDALRGAGATVLEPFVAMATHMLGTSAYPTGRPMPPKFDALQRSAAALGTRAQAVPLNVTFVRGPNAAGVVQNGCVLCGNCVTGCNYGAKNTTLMNYLPCAADAGADLFTGASVRTVERHGERWLVTFGANGGGRARFGAPSMFVTADAVVLAAGSLGSTEILLRSRDAGLDLSEQLGERFTGNGDVLAFAYDTDGPVHGVGLGRRLPSPGSNVGPTITGKVELTDHRGRPMLLEEGTVPGSLAPLLGPTLVFAAAATARARGHADAGTRARLWRQALSTALGPYRGPMDRTLTYLIMGVDDDAGELRLERDRLQIDLAGNGNGNGSSSNRPNGQLRDAVAALGGTFLTDPMAGGPFGRSMVTVHPLGGCVMGDDAEHGVVDDVGRVFDGANGTNRHPGLYVLDGSIVPRPLGINPLLTISALAERACAAMIGDGTTGAAGGRRRGARAAPPVLAERDRPSRLVRMAAPLPGLIFTEAMSGPISTRVGAGRPDPEGSETGPDRKRLCEAGAAGGEREGSRIGFVLTVTFDDLNALLRDPAHPGRLSGTVEAPALSPAPMVVTEGTFGLFTPDPERVDGSLMRYRMLLLAEDGARVHFDGFKVLGKRSMLRTWPDTTTLYTTVRDAAGGLGSETEFAGAIRCTGVLRLSPSDFGKQLTTIRATNVGNGRLRSRYQNAFTRMFAGTLIRMYGRVLDARPDGPDAGRHTPGRPVRAARRLVRTARRGGMRTEHEGE